MSRSQFKGIFCKKTLLNVLKTNKKLKQNQFIVQNKNHLILPEHLSYTALIYNGKQIIRLLITDQMIGYKFGEFINTRAIYKYVKKIKTKKK